LALMRQELDLLLRARAGMEPLSRRLFDDRLTSLDRAERLRATIGRAEDRLLHEAGERLRRVRDTALEERQALDGVASKVAEARTEARAVGREVTTLALAALERRFYDLTVTSDVGLIDVAWARKDLRSDEIAHLVATRKRELQMVEAELGVLVPDAEGTTSRPAPGSR
jgi:hypothetical protein